MRKIIVIEFISLDGVIQAPGGKDEDISGGFKSGGWIAPHMDEVLGKSLDERMKGSFDLLLGRKTFDIWAGHWPHHGDEWPAVNQVTKYVASNSVKEHQWKPSVFIGGNTESALRRIKSEDGPDLHVWGSADFAQTLLRHDLVDTLSLKIFPVTLGPGKRLFEGGSVPAAWKVVKSVVTSKGVILVDYQRDGELQTADVDNR